MDCKHGRQKIETGIHFVGRKCLFSYDGREWYRRETGDITFAPTIELRRAPPQGRFIWSQPPQHNASKHQLQEVVLTELWFSCCFQNTDGEVDCFKVSFLYGIWSWVARKWRSGAKNDPFPKSWSAFQQEILHGYVLSTPFPYVCKEMEWVEGFHDGKKLSFFYLDIPNEKWF